MDGGLNPQQQPQQAAASGHAPGHGAPVKKVRVSRRHGKEARPPACGTARGTARGNPAEPAASARRKVPHVPRVQSKVSPPDSSSEDSGGQSADTRTGDPDRATLGGGADQGLGGRGVPLTSSDLTGRLGDAQKQQQQQQQQQQEEEELLRDLEELRAENEYLKDEMEELRAEMLEMRDTFLEEKEEQLQELRAQLEGAQRTCRVLQYRLRKAERRSLCVARNGQVDGELVGTLEQDVKVARDVSVRLHAELSRAEDHWNRLEHENQELREKLLDLEVANQVLKEEVDKARENSLRKRGPRSSTKADRKSSQDDIADLKCQLHFAKEESLLMCKKLTKTAKESEAMREELARYRALYGDVDTPLSGEMTAGSPYTREAEVKVHLRLVEEEANLLSRRIMELEVENRGLQAEMEELKEKEAGPGADSMRELKRHLQFVEGEAELVQHSMAELEEQNWALKTRLGRARAELELKPDSDTLSQEDEEPLEGEMQSRAQHGNLHSHIDRKPPPLDGPAGGKQELMVGEERNAQKDCCCPSSLRSKDRETLVAVREQAHLVGATIRLLLRPGPDSTAPFWPRGLLAGTLASRLEVLQVLLLGLLEGAETLGSCGQRQVEGVKRESAGTLVPPLCHHDLVKEVAAEQKDLTVPQVQGQEAKANQELQGTGGIAETEETCTQMLSLRLWHHDSKTLELRQDAQLLVLRLRCFLKQWRKGQVRDPGRKDSLQVGSDLGSTLQDLKGALRDLSAILHKECQGSLEHEQQFHHSKTTWEMDRSELRREVRAAHPQLDPKDTEAERLSEVLQRGCEEHTQPMVADPCITIRESSQDQWMCEKMELLDRLCHEQNPMQAKLDAQSLQRKTSERKSSLETEAQKTNSKRRNCAVSPQLGNEGFPDCSADHRAKAEGSRKREDSERYPFFAHSDLGLVSGKNWMYLTEEAGALKGNEPFKTWDCPTWTSTFPGLDLGHGWVRRSCTAPEKSGLRIYYSPPHTRRITPRPARETGKKEEETAAKSEEFKSLSNSTESVDSAGTLAITYENWINQFSEQQRDLLENGPASLTSGTGFPLPFEHLEMSGNLSDDMKEMTYSMRQAARPGPPETRLRDAACQTSEEEDAGDPKAPVPLLVSVGLQTEAPSSSTATQNRKSWPPRVSSLGTARVRHISVCLERVPDRSKRSRCGSPKLQRRLLCSSSTSRLDSGQDHLGLWGLPQRDTSAPALTQSTSTQGSPSGPFSSVAEEARTVESNKAANKVGSAHKYGIVQEFFRNVCSRGHTPTLGGRRESMKTMVPPCGDRRALVEDKKAEHPASRATSLVRSNSFSKIVNKRLTNQSPRDERGGASRAPRTAERTMSGSTLEDVACDCTSQSLTSCFSRSSRSFSHHTPGQCKPRPLEPSITLTTAEKEKLSQD